MPTSAPHSTQQRTLRVLLLEDRAADAELIVEALRRSGFEPNWERVETGEAFKARIDPQLDLILADYRLPRFHGLAALRVLQQRKLDVPFILVTGALGDELAVRCIKAGVTDYLQKDRLERLGPAVSRALEERRLRAEARAVEEQFRQCQKLESAGQLAGGIALDFNNMLSVINGRASLLLDNPAIGDDIRESLGEIYAAGERASHLTRQLLLFSRKRPIRRVLLALNDVVAEVGQMLGRLIGEHVELTLALSPDLPPIDGDAGMLEQVLFNLAVNARDAMPQGGRLTIATQRAEPGPAGLRSRASAAPAAYVCLRISDTGTGIAPEIMPRLFEPCFTTKGPGQGAGLGLATIFGIVKQHHGWIDVASEVGVGTTFDVFLPAADSRANAQECAAAFPGDHGAPPHKGSATHGAGHHRSSGQRRKSSGSGSTSLPPHRLENRSATAGTCVPADKHGDGLVAG